MLPVSQPAEREPKNCLDTTIKTYIRMCRQAPIFPIVLLEKIVVFLRSL